MPSAHIRLSCAAVVASALAFASLAGAASPGQVPGVVQGVATDERGAPLPGVEVTARYQSNPGGVSLSTRSARTGQDGRYRISIAQPVGTWSVHGSVVVEGIRVDLQRDTDALIVGREGAIRNLRVEYLEQTAESPSYGNGGIVLIDRAIGDYPDFSGMQVTLVPVDGRGVATTRTVRNTGEGWVATGFRPGDYWVSATRNGRPMLLTHHGAAAWSARVRAQFTNSGPRPRHMLLQAKASPAQ